MRSPSNCSRYRVSSGLHHHHGDQPTHPPATHRLLGYRALRQLRPRARPELVHPRLILRRRGFGRAAHYVQGSGFQVPRRLARRARETREPTHAHHRGHRRPCSGWWIGARPRVRLARRRYVDSLAKISPIVCPKSDTDMFVFAWQLEGHSVTKIGLPETKLGIIPGAGGTQRATRILGLSKAKDLIFTGRSLTAPEAEELGMRQYQFLQVRCPPWYSQDW
jgi:hypothetical protein